MLTLPSRFLQRMAALLGEEFSSFLAELARPARQTLRANTLKIAPEVLAGRLGLPADPLPWCPEALLLPAEAHLGQHPFHAAGLYYLQEPSATAVVPALDPQPGECILDLCAAPGGKATHIAARIRGQGLLWANEVEARRGHILLQNLERCGVRNAVVSTERPERLAERLAGFFDRVLVDAPCSGEGLFRREPQSVREWSPAAVAGNARRQGHILAAAARLVRPGGVLVYSTCTFAPEENEGVIAAFLQAHPDFSVEALPAVPGFAPGRPEWVPDVPDRVQEQLRRAVRLWPHRAPAEGHFLVRLRRGEGSIAPQPSPWRVPAPSPAALRALAEFWEETLPGAPLPERRALVGEKVLALPDDLPDLTALRLLRAGWLLGAIRGARFVPSHALAMGLPASATARALDLPVEGEGVAAYLRGEPLASAGPAGWLLVTVAGYPLGWGKRVGAVVKNHRPRGLAV